MSEDELKSTLIILLQDEQRTLDLISLYRPQTPTPNPALLTPRFKKYYKGLYKTTTGKTRGKWEREQRLYELVYKEMILGESGLEDVEAEYLRKYKEAPPIRAMQARYSERGKRIFDGFADLLKASSEKKAR
jgi:hypothetical protein